MLLRWFELPWWEIAVVVRPRRPWRLAFPAARRAVHRWRRSGSRWLTSRTRREAGEWFCQAWGFAKQIVPLLLVGVLAAGFLLGRPGHEG